jgi:hypothetical protein
MSRKVQIVRILLLAAVMVAGMTLVPWLLKAVSTSSQFIVEPEIVSAQAEPDVAATHECNIANVAVYNDRVHVSCHNGAAPGGDIKFFAAPTSDSTRVARILSVLLTAQTLGKHIFLGYDTAANGSAYGCQTSNCRPIIWVAIPD